MPKRKRIGEVLLETSVITEEQLEKALQYQQGSKKLLGRILVEQGWATEQDICRALSKLLHIQYVDVSKALISQNIIRLVPGDLAVKHHILPVFLQNTTLYLVMENPRDINVIQQVEFKTGMDVKALIAPPDQLQKAIRRHYDINDYVGNVLNKVREKNQISVAKRSGGTKEPPEENQIVKLTTLIFSEGIKARASDIHIELLAHNVQVQYRIDGILTRGIKLPGEVYSPLSTRIKVLSGLDIAERKNPQDGHLRVTYRQRKVDLRVSTVMTKIGEKLVIRILDKKMGFDDMTHLGFSQEHLEIFHTLRQQLQGLILVTGPTGCGKTTTLYALLNAIKDHTKHIVTIEDPIEYQLEGISQIQVNRKTGATFASGLRSVLRQDPNIILLGEIRDAETASVAIQASEAGHLVLSTLHATDAIATVSRLLTLDISADLIASSLLVVIAQRLIRRICLRCRKEYQPDVEELHRIGLGDKMSELTFYKGEGCKTCRNTGYYGQIGIFEIFMPNQFLRQEIAKGTGKYEIKRLAIEAGMNTMRENGLEKVRQGLTTIEEVSRVCPVDQDLPQKLEPGKADNQIAIPADSMTQEPLNQPRKSDSVVLLLEEEIQEENPCIVVAEDDPAVRRVLQTILQHKGYQVILAVDGEEALEKIRIAKPDLVILDINMPKKDGFSVCEALRASVQTAFISVIMLTAQSAIESKVRGLAVGADDYMTKPFHPEELLARIDAILRRSS